MFRIDSTKNDRRGHRQPGLTVSMNRSRQWYTPRGRLFLPQSCNKWPRRSIKRLVPLGRLPLSLPRRRRPPNRRLRQRTHPPQHKLHHVPHRHLDQSSAVSSPSLRLNHNLHTPQRHIRPSPIRNRNPHKRLSRHLPPTLHIHTPRSQPLRQHNRLHQQQFPPGSQLPDLSTPRREPHRHAQQRLLNHHPQLGTLHHQTRLRRSRPLRYRQRQPRRFRYQL